MTNAISLLIGWVLDLLFGDPARLPHPIVWFGKVIAFCEHLLNKGSHRKLKGAFTAVTLIVLVFAAVYALFFVLPTWGRVVVGSLLIFYCLAGTTLIREVREVFRAVERSVDEGRRQVARIVGRDTSQLSAQEIRTAALETLAENLSDGVIAPLFWLALGGVPAMVAYKMVNTLDSMIGYRTERYRDFGCWAAHIDDIANYIPARLTALLMVIVGEASKLCNTAIPQSLEASPTTDRQPQSLEASPTTDRQLQSLEASPTTDRQPQSLEASPTTDRQPQSLEASPTTDRQPQSLEASPTTDRQPQSLEASPTTDRQPQSLEASPTTSLLRFVWRNGRRHASPNSGYPEAALAGILDCRFGGPHYYFGELFDKPYIGENPRELTFADMQRAVRINRMAEVLAVIMLIAVYIITNGINV